MDVTTARDTVHSRALALSPNEFEMLCKVVLGETLPATTLTVTPHSRDGGIDVEGRLQTDWLAADFGVQAKRNAADNPVSSDRVHRLGGALLENDYHVGTLVTTASFTGPATTVAESLPVRLVDGETLATTMVEAELGVRRVDDRYTVDDAFWQGFGDDTELKSGAIPLASNLDRVVATLRGMTHTDGTPAALGAWLATHTDHSMDERHVRINANGAVVLGLARTEPAPEGQDRYGPTESGAALLQADGRRRQRLLAGAIRSVEVVDRVQSALADEGPLTVDDIDALVADATNLSQSSVERRASTVRSWLEALPEVEIVTEGRIKQYRRVSSDSSESGGDRGG